jgi:hypothetical protein
MLIAEGCSSEGDGDGTDADNITAATHPCKVKREKTQKTMTDAEVDALGDPVADALLRHGDDCPKNYAEVAAKLTKFDSKLCRGGFSSRFVSERSQQLGSPDIGRLIISRDCGLRSDHGMFFLLDPVDAKSTSDLKAPNCQPAAEFASKGTNGKPICFPDNVELIGQDPKTKQFNFYALEDNEWTLYGSSFDFIDDGYDCSDSLGGACKPKAAVQTRCASCHPGGGLVMKELHFPWVSWESKGTTTPGAADLIGRFKGMLGGRTDGMDLEGRVTKANVEWDAVRADFLKTMKGPDANVPVTPAGSAPATVAEVLRPLFCTMEVNLQSASTSKTLSQIPPSFFVDPIWGVKQEVKVDNGEYQAMLTQNGQQILDMKGCGKSCEQSLGKTRLGTLTDTFFAFTYPIRSQVDSDYVSTLVSKKIVTDDFVKDVLAVDITRPIFSKARCGLLAFAPKGNVADMSPDHIKDGFVDALKKAGADKKSPDRDPAAKLLANLSTDGDAAAHATEAAAFVKACAGRPFGVVEDALAYAVHLRMTTRLLKTKTVRDGTLGILDFAETLPVDKLPDTKQGWNATTCVLE